MYKLKIPKSWKDKGTHNVFNKILLKLSVQPEFKSQRKTPLLSPVLIDDKEEYKVEQIHYQRQFYVFCKEWNPAL